MTETMKNVKQLLKEKGSSEAILTDIQEIIEVAKVKAIRSVDFERVNMYWKIGERIVKEEQNNKERAEYGKYIIINLTNQ